jgi:CRP/FNR family transcriptional regulator
MEKLLDECIDCLFRTNLCKGLPDSDFQSLFESTTQITYKKGEAILKQGLKMDKLVYLNKGIVKFHYNDHGKGLIMTIDKAPTLLGIANLLNEEINAFSIYAIEDCTGCLIDMTKFKFLLMSNHSFMFNVMSISTKMFRKSIFNFISLAHKQVNGRLADILIYLSVNIYESNSFVLSLSRQELAEFAGCSKENVINTLRNFDSDGIIKVSGKNVEILDLDRLHRICKAG